jgi:hypothetical protein
MADVTRAFFFPADEQEVCRTVAQGLGGIHKLMFSRDYGVPERPDQMRVSWGKIDENSPMLAGNAALTEALAGSGVAQATIDRFVELADITEADAEQRARELDAELSRTQNAAPWENGRAYPLGAFARHEGNVWRNMVDGNIFAPGVANWRIVWGDTTEGDPPWTPPSGREDAYMLGERAEVDGIGYTSDINFNTTRPGTLNAAWTPDSVPLDTWKQPGTVIPGSSPPAVYPAYMTDQRVIWPYPEEGGVDYVWRSKIDNNTAEPSRDSGFFRYWEPESPA